MNNVVFKDNNTIEYDGDTLIRVTQDENISESSNASKPSKAYIDAPASGATISTNNYTVKGWFVDSAGVSKVEILIDGSKVGVAEYGGSRPDVQKVHPDYVNSANSGFQYNLDTSGLANGNHTLTARAINSDGKASTKKVSFTIAKSPKALVIGRWTSGGDALQFNANGKVDIYSDGSQEQSTYKLSNESNNSIIITIIDSDGSSSSETAVFQDENTMVIGDTTLTRHK
ncbi:MAG TPA: Ig-like domain-containing protein, partial [Syntrophomonadaceae bacterium]|nr:Ig-like domain-containing protein [Syntrophomonadaceae bacterium]